MLQIRLISSTLLLFLLMSPLYGFAQSIPLKAEVLKACALVGENNVEVYLGKEIYPLASKSWSVEQLAKFRISIDDDELGLSAWILSMSKDRKLRKAALLIQQFSMFEILKSFDKNSLLNYTSLIQWDLLFTNYQNSLPYTQARVNLSKDKINLINKDRSYQKNLTKVKWAAPLLCPNYACIWGLKDVVNFTAPKDFNIDDSSTVLSFTPIWQEVLTNSTYQQALAKLSLIISEKIQRFELSQESYSAKDHFFDDVLNSFHNIGISDKDAKKMAYNILGLYGSRGASLNFIKHLVNQENYPTAIMLQFIFAAVSYLDSIHQQNSASLYSLPAEIKTTCDFGKPYHFWMSAFLTQKLKRSKLKKSSLYGAHLMGNLYEAVNSTTFGRETLLTPFTSELNSLKNHSIRIGITYRDLGALWALNQQQWDLDDALYQLTLRTKKLSNNKITKLVNNPSPLRIYRSWKKMFDSDYLIQNL